MTMKNSKQQITEIAEQYDITESVVRYHLRKGKTLNDIRDYYEQKNNNEPNDVEERINELTATKLGAQIENIRITSSERTLKIEKALKELVPISECNAFVVKVISIMKAHRSLLISELPNKVEGLSADDITPILIDFEKELDTLISKDIQKFIEDLERDE